MRRSGETNPSRGFWKPIFPAIVLLCTLPLVAQKAQEPSPPKYDVHTETKMKGTVEEVKLPPKGSQKEVAHLLVKTGTDTANVYLCPKSFLDDMGVNFSKGDEIALTGSKVKQGEADLILAREVVKGTDTPSFSATRKAIPSGVGTADRSLKKANSHAPFLFKTTQNP